MSKLLIPYSNTKRKVPVNLKKEDAYIFENELLKVIPPLYLEERIGCFISPDFQIFKNYLLIDRALSPIRTLPKNIKSQFLFTCKNMFFRKKRILTGEYIYVIDDWSEGYFHWMTDVLPRLMALKMKFGSRLVLLPNSFKGKDFVVETLKVLGFFAIYFGNEFLKVEKCLFIKSELVTGNYHESLLMGLRSKFKPLMEEANPERLRIYVSRNFASKRKIQNEDELEGVLKKYGFAIEYFEKRSWLDQVKIINKAQFLISVHGAGLTNMLFLKPKSKVLELRRKKDSHNNCYFALSSALDLDYYYLECDTDLKNTNVANFFVDPEEFENTIKFMLRTEE